MLKNLLLVGAFASLAASNAFAQNPNCEIDRIEYKQYYLLFLGSKGPFQDYKTMLEKDVPAMYWTDYYENNKIVKRKFGTTLVGTNRTETYYYKDSLLSHVSFSGGFTRAIDFYYDAQKNLIKSQVFSDILGDRTTEFSYAADSIFVKEETSEGIAESVIVVDAEYLKNRYPYGNHLVYDEIFNLYRSSYPEEHDYEQYYDDCQNLKYHIRKRKGEDTIFEMKVFDIKYK